MRGENRWLMLSLLFFLFISSLHAVADEEAHDVEQKRTEIVRFILIGATGNLAAKYLWVTCVRLAFEAALRRGQEYHFIAGGSFTKEQGEIWQRNFFDDAFAARVCGNKENTSMEAATAQMMCRDFYLHNFIPNVQYIPLWMAKHYTELAAKLNEENRQFEEHKVEIGRIVYLAIPPQAFIQTCEFIHQDLRPLKSAADNFIPFLRVVIEKPFGRDLSSAQHLADMLHSTLNEDELYLIDHYAGKPAVQAMRSYINKNYERLHELWDSKYIREMQVQMSEVETLEHRIDYFHNNGIIRDVMVNHLQLLLGDAVSPSFKKQYNSDQDDVTQDQPQRVRFINSLKWSTSDDSFLVGQYEEYGKHYKMDIGRELSLNDSYFTATAARVELISSLPEWQKTKFVISAAKASSERLLTIKIIFKDGAKRADGSRSSSSCELIFTIQKAKSEIFANSARIDWSCDLLDGLEPPDGWSYGDSHKPMMLPIAQNPTEWELGDAMTAYDVLLREVVNGNKMHFVNVDEVLAAWTLWSPILVEGEATDGRHYPVIIYRSETSPWRNGEKKTEDIVKAISKDEL